MNHPIVLSGYYGELNSGDDALLIAAAWGSMHILGANAIQATCAQLPALPDSVNMDSLFVQKENIKSENLFTLYQACINADYLLYGGGSVFHSSDKMARDCDLLDLNRRKGGAAVGVSFGPFRDSGAEAVASRLADNFFYIGCRDEESVDIIQKIAPQANVEKTFDLAVLLPLAANSTFSYPAAKKRGLGLAFCHYERYIGKEKIIEAKRVNKLIETLNRLTVDDVEELVFIDFNGHPLFGDTGIHKEIIEGLHTNIPIKHLHYHRDPIQVLKTIAQLKGIVGMRLHSSIFGYITNTPTIILSYHPKCDGWAKQIAASQTFTIDSQKFEIDQLQQAILAILAGKYEQPGLPLKEAQKLAMKNWEGVLCSMSQL